MEVFWLGFSEGDAGFGFRVGGGGGGSRDAERGDGSSRDEVIDVEAFSHSYDY